MNTHSRYNHGLHLVVPEASAPIPVLIPDQEWGHFAMISVPRAAERLLGMTLAGEWKVVDPASLELPRAFEARAWSEFYLGSWVRALRAGKRWLRDQPFSASPAVHASYVASVALEDYEEGVRIANSGLLANPNDPTLLNNLSYSLANFGRLQEAEAALSR
jgi:hypothetical protein